MQAGREKFSSGAPAMRKVPASAALQWSAAVSKTSRSDAKWTMGVRFQGWREMFYADGLIMLLRLISLRSTQSRSGSRRSAAVSKTSRRFQRKQNLRFGCQGTYAFGPLGCIEQRGSQMLDVLYSCRRLALAVCSLCVWRAPPPLEVRAVSRLAALASDCQPGSIFRETT